MTADLNENFGKNLMAENLLNFKYIYKLGSLDKDFDVSYPSYSLSVDEFPHTLNMWRSPILTEEMDAVKLSVKMYELVNECNDSLRSFETTEFDRIRETHTFKKFSRLSVQLQSANISQFDEPQKKAFFLNIYNCLILHARFHLASVSAGFINEGRNFLSYRIGMK